MKTRSDFLFLIFLSLCASFIVTTVLPFFGHIMISMAFGCWSCYKASIPIIWTVFLGCVIGSALGGWIIFDHLIPAIIFVVASAVGFWGMYFYTLKQPYMR